MANRWPKLTLNHRRRHPEAVVKPHCPEIDDDSVIPNTPEQQGQAEPSDSDVTVDGNATATPPPSVVIQRPTHTPPDDVEGQAASEVYLEDSGTPNDDGQTEWEEIPQVHAPAWQEIPTDYDSAPPPFTVSQHRHSMQQSPRPSQNAVLTDHSNELGTERLNKRLAKVMEGKKPPSPSDQETDFSILGYFRKCLSKYNENLKSEVAKEAQKEAAKVRNLEKAMKAKKASLRPFRRFRTRGGLSTGSETQATIKGPHDDSTDSDSDLPTKKTRPAVGKGVKGKGPGKGKEKANKGQVEEEVDYERLASQHKAAFWEQKAANALKEAKLLDEQLNVELLRQRALTKEYKLDE